MARKDRRREKRANEANIGRASSRDGTGGRFLYSFIVSKASTKRELVDGIHATHSDLNSRIDELRKLNRDKKTTKKDSKTLLPGKKDSLTTRKASTSAGNRNSGRLSIRARKNDAIEKGRINRCTCTV